MSTVAVCGSSELVEDGPRLVFIERGTGGYAVAIFVCGLSTFIVGANSVIQVVLALQGGGLPVLALALAAVAVAAGFATWWLVRRRQVLASAPIAAQPIRVVLDRDQKTIEDGAGQVLAPLDGASFREAFQIGSSSKALELVFAGRALVVARGSPFSGSIDDIADALRARGFRVT